jgi:hypothetical protein
MATNSIPRLAGRDLVADDRGRGGVSDRGHAGAAVAQVRGRCRACGGNLIPDYATGRNGDSVDGTCCLLCGRQGRAGAL